MFKKVSILGAGLLGGSIAKAIQKHVAEGMDSCLLSRKPAVTGEIESLGLRVSMVLEEVVKGADLLILATPVGAMPELLKASYQAGLPTHCLITDVGSVKAFPHESLEGLIPDEGCFIGSHPIAGSEKIGILAAKADLFEDKVCFLTLPRESKKRNLGERGKSLESFWQQLGARTQWIDFEEHDKILARLSHYPHLMASLITRVSLEGSSEVDKGYIGSGWLDTTRVAEGDPSMWADIFLKNRDSILKSLKLSQLELMKVTQLIENADEAKLLEWLEEAQSKRKLI